MKSCPAVFSSFCRALIETNPLPVVVVGRDGLVFAANRKAVSLFALEEEKNGCLSYHSLFPSAGDVLAPFLAAAFKGEEIRGVLLSFSAPEKSGQWVADFVPAGEKGEAVLIIFREEVTEISEREEKNIWVKKAYQDGLTGLYNYQYLKEHLEGWVEAAAKAGISLALLMLDIDYFKNYNDVFGHPAGDQLLREMACILKNCVRSQDVVVRYGGEEFCIFLNNADVVAAREIAERIREEIENYPFPGREEQPEGKITVSIGIAVFPHQARNGRELILFADEALYRAKNRSRNRVEVYFSYLDNLRNGLSPSEVEILNRLKAILVALDIKNRQALRHAERVTTLASRLAQRIGLEGLELEQLQYAAFLHDVGKIEIPRDIFTKKGPLDKDELRCLYMHPLWGAEIVSALERLKPAAEIIRYHHERYDGCGYPYRLSGREIPLGARILAIADSYEAMTSPRPYRRAMTTSEALTEICLQAGRQFDPCLARIFVGMMKEGRE